MVRLLVNVTCLATSMMNLLLESACIIEIDVVVPESVQSDHQKLGLFRGSCVVAELRAYLLSFLIRVDLEARG